MEPGLSEWRFFSLADEFLHFFIGCTLPQKPQLELQPERCTELNSQCPAFVLKRATSASAGGASDVLTALTSAALRDSANPGKPRRKKKKTKK